MLAIWRIGRNPARRDTGGGAMAAESKRQLAARAGRAGRAARAARATTATERCVGVEVVLAGSDGQLGSWARSG